MKHRSHTNASDRLAERRLAHARAVAEARKRGTVDERAYRAPGSMNPHKGRG
jgi:hypothetical protein